MGFVVSWRIRAVSVSVAIICQSGLPTMTCAGDWIIAPRVGGQEIFTDNVLLAPTNPRSDFVTSVSPGINISGESSRIKAIFDYSPIAYLYALNPSQNSIGHNLYANGTATVIHNLFFFDARGYASLQPSLPGLATGTLNTTVPLSGVSSGIGGLSQGLSRAELAQVSSFSASPYIVHRFDDIGTGELRYTLSNTNFSGSTNTKLAPAGFSLQNTTATTHDATATFLTGTYFGAYAARVLFDAAQSVGTGVLANASQRVAIVDSAYAINRRISALTTLGYESLHFGGIPSVSIDNPVWGVGLKLTPSPDTTITVNYGHRNGVTAPYVVIVYPLSTRTTLSATYSEGLVTTAQEIANNLAVSNVNEAGQLVDTRTLLPLAIVDSSLGLQSGLFRVRQLRGTADIVLARNHIAASIYRSQDLSVAQNRSGSGTSQDITGVTLTWSRDINPLTTANMAIGYTHYSFTSAAQSELNLVTFSATISHRLNSSLTAWAGYNRLDRKASQAQLRLTSDTIFVGLSKSF